MNPWNIQSLYDLQYYNCPECIYKINSKQEFINHAYSFHPESEEYLRNINDGSINDIEFPPHDVKMETIADTDLAIPNGIKIDLEEFDEEIKEEICQQESSSSIGTNAFVVVDSLNMETYFCDICNSYFCNQNALQKHKEFSHDSKHEENPEKPKKKPSSAWKKWKSGKNDCELCGKIFSDYSNYIRHVSYFSCNN